MNGLLEFQPRNPICGPVKTDKKRKSAEKFDSSSSSNKRKDKPGTEVIFPKVDIDKYIEILKFIHGENKSASKDAGCYVNFISRQLYRKKRNSAEKLDSPS
ncbi:hypothetical protein AVEN_127649-1 [Araneus ventricosus]|uniref:Uncharacterized protein n=1 Tax=Araneus ventricosus TaxID=182803 RepID=A0A4Y2RK82_ARAVE|nr:hypothetical protein AVEN_127649-1 [Araneus ventricosus]